MEPHRILHTSVLQHNHCRVDIVAPPFNITTVFNYILLLPGTQPLQTDAHVNCYMKITQLFPYPLLTKLGAPPHPTRPLDH